MNERVQLVSVVGILVVSFLIGAVFMGHSYTKIRYHKGYHVGRMLQRVEAECNLTRLSMSNERKIFEHSEALYHQLITDSEENNRQPCQRISELLLDGE